MIKFLNYTNIFNTYSYLFSLRAHAHTHIYILFELEKSGKERKEKK